MGPKTPKPQNPSSMDFIANDDRIKKCLLNRVVRIVMVSFWAFDLLKYFADCLADSIPDLNQEEWESPEKLRYTKCKTKYREDKSEYNGQ